MSALFSADGDGATENVKEQYARRLSFRHASLLLATAWLPLPSPAAPPRCSRLRASPLLGRRRRTARWFAEPCPAFARSGIPRPTLSAPSHSSSAVPPAHTR